MARQDALKKAEDKLQEVIQEKDTELLVARMEIKKFRKRKPLNLPPHYKELRN